MSRKALSKLAANGKFPKRFLSPSGVSNFEKNEKRRAAKARKVVLSRKGRKRGKGRQESYA